MTERRGADYNSFMRLLRELDNAKRGYVRIGILSEGHSEDGINVLEYAIYNEYGTSTVPARPFLREATESPNGSFIISNYVEQQLSKIINTKGAYTAKDALTAIGEFVRGRIIASIKTGRWAPNAPSTIKGKNGRTTPLIDSGDLIRSIDFEVVL